MKPIKEKYIILIILVLIFGGIGLFKLAGVWSTETNKVPVKFSSGELAGEYNPDDIRGSYTLDDIATLFEIPEDVLKAAFNIPLDTDATAFKSKDLEGLYEGVEIGNDSMKAFVAVYKSIDYDLTDVLLPDEAVDILLEAHPEFDAQMVALLNATRVSALGSTTTESSVETPVETTAAPDDQTNSGETVTSTENTLSSEASTSTETTEPTTSSSEAGEEEHEEPLVNGNTTFMQVLNAGVTEAEIETIIGGKIPSTAMTVKDYCTNNGIGFSTVKTALSDLMSQ